MKTLDEKLQLAINEVIDQFDDELWVELIQKSPHSVELICIMLSLDLQIEKETSSIKID